MKTSFEYPSKEHQIRLAIIEGLFVRGEIGLVDSAQEIVQSLERAGFRIVRKPVKAKVTK